MQELLSLETLLKLFVALPEIGDARRFAGRVMLSSPWYCRCSFFMTAKVIVVLLCFPQMISSKSVDCLRTLSRHISTPMLLLCRSTLSFDFDSLNETSW